MSLFSWNKDDEFDQQSQLLHQIYAQQEERQVHNGEALSLKDLADRQRIELVGCIYLAGSRIDNKACFGSRHVGVLISSLPTDYLKAIAPAFHSDHDELMVCIDGEIVIEWSSSLSPDATVETTVLNPGEYFIVKSKWPHRISLAPLRAITNEDGSLKELDGAEGERALESVRASFLAVKMGSLSGKSLRENMAQAPEDTEHPIVSRWRADEETLEKIRRKPETCQALYLPTRS